MTLSGDRSRCVYCRESEPLYCARCSSDAAELERLRATVARLEASIPQLRPGRDLEWMPTRDVRAALDGDASAGE